MPLICGMRCFKRRSMPCRSVACELGQPMQLPYALHNPNFVVDLSAIPVGASVATISMLELLQPASK